MCLKATWLFISADTMILLILFICLQRSIKMYVLVALALSCLVLQCQPSAGVVPPPILVSFLSYKAWPDLVSVVYWTLNLMFHCLGNNFIPTTHELLVVEVLYLIDLLMNVKQALINFLLVSSSMLPFSVIFYWCFFFMAVFVWYC